MVNPTHGQTQNEIKLLVKGGGELASLRPGVDDRRSIRILKREVAGLPAGLIEGDIKNLQEVTVDIA